MLISFLIVSIIFKLIIDNRFNNYEINIRQMCKYYLRGTFGGINGPFRGGVIFLSLDSRLIIMHINIRQRWKYDSLPKGDPWTDQWSP